MSSNLADWRIESFESKRHRRDSFECGSPALDDYIRRYASQDQSRNVARVFVACDGESDRVGGYYTLSAASFEKSGLPIEIAKKLPSYPVPAAILGRLAIDKTSQGKGLGETLLMDCFSRVIRASASLAVQAVIADAKDEKAKRFYEKYGFQPFLTQPLRMFIPLATLIKASGA
jgi:GNAT superfamily N-acetyltransferase